MKGLAHDLKRTGDIDQVHLVVKGDQNLNGVGSIAGVLNCTHLDGIGILEVDGGSLDGNDSFDGRACGQEKEDSVV